jgi:hypothetical protein
VKLIFTKFLKYSGVLAPKESTRILSSGYFGCAAQQSRKIQRQESPMLDPAYTPGIAEWNVQKMVKEDRDCVTMQ